MPYWSVSDGTRKTWKRSQLWLKHFLMIPAAMCVCVCVCVCVCSFAGGYCPGGGGRVWPIADYWSYNEVSQPFLCRLAEAGACPGVVPNQILNAQNLPSGQKVTQVCSLGYTGTACNLCSPGYFATENKCWSCGSDTTMKAYFGSMVVVAIGVTGVLALSVAILPADRLSFFIAVYMTVQNIIAVGKAGSTSLPHNAQWVAQLFNAASIVNFDIEYFQPGCNGPAITFLQLYWYTFLLWILTGLCFYLACRLRLALRLKLDRTEARIERTRSLKRQETIARLQKEASTTPEDAKVALEMLAKEERAVEEQKARDFIAKLRVSPEVDYKRRIMHATLILLSIYYLKMSTLCVRGLVCSYAPDPAPLDGSAPSPGTSLYLDIDKSQRCFHGNHLVSEGMAVNWNR